MRKINFKKKYIFILLFVLILAVICWLIISNYDSFINKKIDNITKPKQKEESEPFTFAVAGDNHNNLEIYNKIIQNVNQNDNSFFVDLGDSTRVGGASEYAALKSALDVLKVPYHMVMGDHDKVGDGFQIWQQYFGATYYSWGYQNVHFIVLNDAVNKNGFSEEQLSWLENDLSSTQKELKIIFLHRPPSCPFTDPEDLGFTGPQSEEHINQFIDIAKKYKVNKMFAGHIHNYLNYSISGIPITVTGGAGGPIYNIPLVGKDKYHYVEVKVTGSDIQQQFIEL